ncbi:DUF2336 domain-containing protein [Enterovirga sp. DB1703]|uniref:DUF2336 domain-containing protein n=1 Tax=Enterovirga aerilata TaxID=2730920 RepID=A0A849I0J4_9HYPH|nr:DUF2336 domain-containing protein [Enterovirga sp. DB1703]
MRRFLLWARSASPGHRAEATGALARAFLYSDLSEADRWEAETALTAMLDDPSAIVRRAMAESLAASPDAPRHIMVALAADAPEVAELVLARSPVLIDADLVDAAAIGDDRVQCAIASRAPLSRPVAAALGEIGRRPALVRLARNRGADIGHSTLVRMVERHGDHAPLRETLLARPDLPVDIAQAIAAALARALESFVVGCGWLSPERSGRITREACERTTVALSAQSERDEVGRLVAYLRESQQLTPALMLRAILSGELAFVEAAFCELTEVSPKRVAGFCREPGGHGFRAMFAKAGLPAALRPAFEAALAALRGGTAAARPAGARLSRGVIERALAACSDLPPDQAGRLVALLRRFEVEAAREEARLIADELADEAALDIVMRHAPEILLEGPESPSSMAA